MRRVAPFDPTQVAGCKLWLDGSDAGSITLSSGLLTQWNDKSGNNNTMTPYSSYSNVTISSAYQNGLNVLNFSGSGVYRAPTSSAVYPLDLYIVLALKDTTSSVDVIGINTNTSGTDFNSLTFGEYTSSRWHNGSDFFNRTPNTVSPTNETSTSFLLINWSIANSNYIIRRNGVQLSQTSSYTFTLPAGSIFQIGYRVSTVPYPTPDHPFKGYIAEIVAFNSQLATSQQEQVEGYLAQKWGLKNNLPGGHLGITTTIYPTPRTLSMTPRSYAVTVTPTGYSGCSLWLDASDPAGTGVAPSNGATVSTWTDKSGNSANGTATGTPTYSSSSRGVSFNGSSAFSLPNGTIAPGASNFAIFIVCYPTDLSAYPYVYGAGGNSVDTATAMLFYPDGQIENGFWTDFMGIAPSGSVSTNTLAMFTSAYNGTRVLYKNGTSIVSGSPSGTKNVSTANNYIGRRQDMATEYFSGIINEFIVFNTALSTVQRQTIEGYLAWKWGLQGSFPSDHPYKSASPNITNPYNVTRQALPSALFPTPKTNTGFAPNSSIPSYTITNGLVSFFLFNTTILDSQNTITLSRTGSVSYVTGLRGHAIYLANEANISNSTFSSNYLSSTYSFPSTFTVSLWFRTANSSPAGAIFNTNRNPTYVQGAVTLYYAGGSLYAAYTSVQNNGAGYAISANTWYNAVVTYNSGTTYLYVNGSQSGSAVNLTPVVINQGFMLGGAADNGPVYPFAGYIEDFRIYNRVLSGSEITAIYNGTG